MSESFFKIIKKHTKLMIFNVLRNYTCTSSFECLLFNNYYKAGNLKMKKKKKL